jgi:hypothetical protein
MPRAGGGNANDSRNVPQSAATHPRPASNLQRLANLNLFEMSSEDCFSFIAHSVPFIKQFERSWRIPGSKFADFHPSVVIPNIQLEFPFIPRSAALEILRCVQTKIVNDWNRVPSDEEVDTRIRPEVVPEWINFELPALVIPNPEPSPVNQVHGGGAVQGHQNVAIHPPPPRIGANLPSGVNTLFSPSSYGGGAFNIQQPSFETPLSQKKFAFGRRASDSTPVALAQHLVVAPNPQFAQVPFGQQPLAQVPFGQQPLAQVPIGQQHPAQVPIGQQHPAQVPNGQQHPAQVPNGQQHPAQVPNGQQLQAQVPIGQQLLSHPVSQVNFDHEGRAYMPWEIEAFSRPARPQDPDMMPGFKRLSIAAIIAQARAARMASIAQGQATAQQVFKKVDYPEMQAFTEAEYLRVRKEYYIAVQASIPSCNFKDFKFCMTDVCRVSAMRKFSLDYEGWIAKDDDSIQSWFGLFFGPKSREDAEERLEQVKFPEHRDAIHSQNTFVNKLEICAYEFEMVINDIANTHRTWKQDSSSLSSGTLTLKDVMLIWRTKFDRQLTHVFSVQIKNTRRVLERDKDVLFNDVVAKIVHHYNEIDGQVARGKISYSTQPRSDAFRQNDDRRASTFTPRQPTGDRSTSANPKGSYGNKLPGQDFHGTKRGRDHPNTPASRPRKVVAGNLRGVSCGSTTNHYGLGCHAHTCVFFKTSHDRNKNGHRWQDSDKEASVEIPRPEYTALLKANPQIVKNWTAAKDQQKQAKFKFKISALQAGETITDESNESEVDSDDANAAADEFAETHGTDSEDEVNTSLCSVSALPISCSSSGDILRENKMTQFFGVSRLIGNDGIELQVKTLLDPGAEFNIVSPEYSKICAVESRQVQLAFAFGEKKKRSCMVQEMSRCRFELFYAGVGFVKHVEWFAVADLKYDLLLGRKFCKDNGFTNFDWMLKPWSTDDINCIAAVNELPIICEGSEAEAASMVDEGFQIALLFPRVDAPVGQARHKRQAKTLKCVLPSASSVDAISPSSIVASNPLSSLRIIEDVNSGDVRKVLLSFTPIRSSGFCESVQEWFVVDEAVAYGYVHLSPSTVAKHNLAMSCKRYHRQTSQQPGSSGAAAPSTDENQNNKHAAIRIDGDTPRSSIVEKRIRVASHAVAAAMFKPLLIDHHAIGRFSRRGARFRSAQPFVIDDFAAHNSINNKLLHDETSPVAIKIFDKKRVDDIDLVLLEFSLDCANKACSRQHFVEWFRVVEDVSPISVIIKGCFDEARLNASRVLFKRQLNVILSTRHSDDELFTRGHAPVRDNMPNEIMTRDTSDALDRAKALLEKSTAARLDSSNFASFHPVSHFRLRRDANKPIHPFPSDNRHASSRINMHYNDHHHALTEAYQRAEISATILYQTAKLRSRLSGETSIPIDVRRAELRKLQHDAALLSHNFEHAIDDVASLASHVATLPDANDTSPSWRGDNTFKPGTYVEIGNAVLQTHLNGLRVRLYEKTADELVWKIRVLGKHQGIMRCHEKFLIALPSTSQARSRPAGCDAGFLDTAIDETGQPTGDSPQLAHRQFGAEYSAALTERIEQLKLRYPHVFTKDVTEPCGFEEMDIKLIPNAILPSKARFYRNTPKMKEEVHRQIQEQLDWNAIRKSETAHCSDILLVKRPHMPGQWRFVINFQKLNEATVPEQLIMPDPVSQHSRLAGCKIFGAFDLSSYFRQLRLKESCQYLTGFASDMGTFVHTRVPMGIRNAPSFAQRVLQEALANDPNIGPRGIKNYFDDVPFGAKDEDEFIQIMTEMLDFCAKWQLKINPDKSVFGVTSITHVGFVISEVGVSIDPERVKDLSELAAPKSIKKVQSVLGVLNYVRNFVENFSLKAKFLTDKLSTCVPVNYKRPRDKKATAEKPKPIPFVWSPEDQLAFEDLKRCVLAAPILAQLDYSKQIFVRCDASRFGAGAVLFQYDESGRELVVCYASRKFLPAETRWSTFQQEASTVVWALERFLEFTQGYHVIVECDHRNISFVKRSCMPQLARWRMRLQDHDFSIRFLQGCQNLVADGLSRGHVDDVEVSLMDTIPECSLLYAKPSDTIDYAEVASYQTRLKSRKNLVADDNADVSDDAAVYLSDSDDDSDSVNSDDDNTTATAPRFGVRGELLQSDGSVAVEVEPQPAQVDGPLLVPDDEIKFVHNDLVGHKGVYVTLQRLLRNGRSWSSRTQMIADIDSFLSGCDVCQKMKKRRSQTLVNRHTISGSPFAELSIDILKLPKVDARGNKYCVAIIDNFSRWISLTACVNKSAFEASRALVNFIGNFGAPLRLRSDGGGEFVNGVIVGVTRMMGVTQHVVQAYTPTANGIVERANRSILEHLRELVYCDRLSFHTHHQWGDLLPLVQRALNASIHLPIGTSPARILFGDSLDLDRAILTRIPDNKSFDVDSYVDSLTSNQRIILEESERLQSLACDRVIQKSLQSQRVKVRGKWVEAPAKVIAVNDWVLAKPQPDFPLHKLAPRWLGPFRVLSLDKKSDMVSVFDSVSLRTRNFLRRQLEVFDMSRVTDVSGLTKVAEKDSFEFPVEAIMGHALIQDQGVGVDAVQLPRDFKRGVRSKNSFQFLVKWAGYVEPTWVAYKNVRNLVQFPGYVSVFQGLNML